MDWCKLYHKMNRLWHPLFFDGPYKSYNDVSVIDFAMVVLVLLCLVVMSPLIILIYALNALRLIMEHVWNYLDSIKINCNERK